MLISRETANLMLDDAGILGQDREWILQNHDVVHLGYLVAAILRQGDGSLSTFMK
jgi:hypothetical protein